MSHSHLAIRHLIRQIEKSAEQRSTKPAVPGWLRNIVDRLTDHFEPFSGVARVGYEAQQTDTGWEVALFLGELETVGGADDGERNTVNFRFALSDLNDHFDRLHQVHWNAFPNSHVSYDNAADLSFISIEGEVEGNPLRIQIHTSPPDSAGPALKKHQDGRVEMVE